MRFGYGCGIHDLVFAPNTRQLLILNDASWGFTTLAQATATIATSTWYRLEVTFGASNLVTGRLYSAAGVVVATVSTTVAGLRVAGPALFAFGSCVDTLESR